MAINVSNQCNVQWLLLLVLLLTVSYGESRYSIPCTCRPIENPAALHTVPQLIRDQGYTVEVHNVTTRDGYILEMHRILPTNHKPKLQNPFLNSQSLEKESIGNLCHGKGGHVSFLMHGLLGSSSEFIMNSPDRALAYMMADAGWDVWMGNNRGNTYSRKHKNLDPDTDSKFWDFSWDTMGRYDLPAMLEYVRNHTGFSKIDFVGHSMGTRTFMAMMHYHPYIKSWINVMASLGPDVYINHMFEPAKTPLRLASIFEATITRTRGGEILESSLTADTCPVINSTIQFCKSNILQLVNSIRGAHIVEEFRPIIEAHNPAGSSIRSIAHYGQLLSSRGFTAYDYGRQRNLLEYGSVYAPELCLQRAQVPVALYWGEGDIISHPEDVKRLAAELPNVIVNHKVKYKEFGHLDFIWSKNATYIYYHLMRTFLNNACNNKL
ncbi:unnamed protein product [Meganyctiphanes norvegica]|uniref:Lipase n=2 Tax=Meganyctiphanes norvegica TaxID=48144 RepID=A0AAV2QHY6_MEGNR